MRVLVTFALENEFAPWKAMHDFQVEDWAMAEAQCAKISGVDVGVLLTGVGPQNAIAASHKAMRRDTESGDVCISAGLAGALKPAYSVGQVLAAKGVQCEQARGDFPAGVFECSNELVSAAGDKGATVVERFCTTVEVAATAADKQRLGAQADAAEMESFFVLSTASAAGIPAVAIRVVSDTAGEDLPIDMSHVFGEDGQVSVPRVLGQVARHPRAIPGLVRLGRNSKKAAESLAQFLDSYVGALAGGLRASETKAGRSTY
jgi:adenosylhomocysteine nucleosidase